MARIKLMALAIAILLTASPALSNPVWAQATPPQVTLVARAVLPAESYADGPQSGAALAAQAKQINGIDLPFPNQPVSSFTGIIPGQYTDTWWFLSGDGFGTRANSGDYQ